MAECLPPVISWFLTTAPWGVVSIIGPSFAPQGAEAQRFDHPPGSQAELVLEPAVQLLTTAHML